MRIGNLILSTKTKRTDNIGGAVIGRVLRRAGHEIVGCLPEDINKFDLVLYSVPSTYQIIDYLLAARKHHFERRTCKILIGGFGCQNIAAIQQYVDFAYYGRAHLDVAGVVSDIGRHGASDNPHLLTVAAPRLTTVNYSAPLYSDNVISEDFAGCVNMCKFCHYAHVRRKQGGTGGTYVQGLLTGGNSPEVLLKDIPKMTKKPGRVRTAIDGFSSRLRFKYGKRISNDDILRAINHLGSLKESRLYAQQTIFGGVDIVGKRECVVVMAYNIGHMPTETDSDIAELHDTIKRCNPKERVVLILHTTPFRPSLLTPMQWSPVKVFPEWSAKREHTVVDRGNLLAKYSFTMEGAFSHLCSVVIDRYGVYGADDKVLDLVINPKSGNSLERAERLMSCGGEKYTYALHPTRQDPIPHIVSYHSKDKLIKMARSLG